MNNWKEPLPLRCPPLEAYAPNGLTFYRLCRNNPPSDGDFTPSRVVNGMDECILKALSIWDSIDKCLNVIKLPRHKKKVSMIMELSLTSEDGLILQTFKAGHYSWWVDQAFNISSATVMQ